MKKNIWLLIALSILVLLGAFYIRRCQSLRLDYFKGYEKFEDKIPDDPTGRPLVNQQQFLTLGWLNDDPKPHFFKLPFFKKPHVIRIGIFGGSWTVCGGYDKKYYRYTDLLENKFKEAGFKNIEIINFGISSYGFFQEYKLWEFIGQKYDLDYVIFTIHDNLALRDLTFSLPSPRVFCPLHARYTLKNHSLNLISLVGNTRDDIIKTYYDIFPPLRYLLYGKEMPLCLKVFLPQSLHNRVNPFYYKRFTPGMEELHPIYAAMLKNVAQKTKHVIFLENERDSTHLDKMVRSPNVSFFVPQAHRLLKSFLYYGPSLHPDPSPNEHPNPLANQLIADELFAYLTGKATWEGVSLQIKPCLKLFKTPGAEITGSLADAMSVAIKAGETTVAMVEGLPEGNKIKSLLMLTYVDMNSISFLPLSFELKDGQQVFLSFKTGGKDQSIPIGTVHASNKIVGELEGTKGEFGNHKVSFHDKDILNQFRGATEACIMINNTKVLELDVPRDSFIDQIRFFVSGPREYLKLVFKDQLFFIKSENKYFFDGNPFDPKGGIMDFVVTHKNGEQQRCPIFSYQFVSFENKILKPYKAFMQELSESITGTSL